MKVIIKRWGQSAAVRLPTAVMKAANLSIDQAVEIEERDGVITVRPVASGRVTLETSVARTPEVEHRPNVLDLDAKLLREADDAFAQMVTGMQTPESQAAAKSLMTISTKELRESLNKAQRLRSDR